MSFVVKIMLMSLPLGCREFRKSQMGSKTCRFRYNLWPVPPTQRQDPIERITKIFRSFDLVYGKRVFMSEKEARKHAITIENACFLAADELFMEEPHGDGRLAFELYSTQSGSMMSIGEKITTLAP